VAERGRRGSSKVNAGLLAVSDTFPRLQARVDLGVGARHGQSGADAGVSRSEVTAISGFRLLAGPLCVKLSRLITCAARRRVPDTFEFQRSQLVKATSRIW